MTGPLAFDDPETVVMTYDGIEIMKFVSGGGDKNVDFNLNRGSFTIKDTYNLTLDLSNNEYGNITLGSIIDGTYYGGIKFSDNSRDKKWAIITGLSTEQVNSGTEDFAATKGYVDDQIAAIPTPDVSGQIETHNTSETAHANMHWLTADDEMLSSIDPDGSIDADTLEGHPASDFVLKSELASLVPVPDLSKYYTKEEVDAKITQIQQLIDQAAALVDEINGEVI